MGPATKNLPSKLFENQILQFRPLFKNLLGVAMNTLFNQVNLTQKQKIFVKPGSSNNPKMALALMADLAQLGFKLDRKLINKVKTLSQKELKSLHKFLVSNLSLMVGNHVDYTPLFKSFPEDIPGDNGYFFKRIVGFLQNYLYVDIDGATTLSCGCKVDSSLFDVDMFGACPICQMQTDNESLLKRSKLSDKIKLKIIGSISEEESISSIRNLFNSNSSLSESLKSDLKLIVSSLKNDVAPFLPEEISFKENIAVIAGLVVKNTTLTINPNWFKTATDVLRLSVALSDGDVSLASDDKFKLSNKERNLILFLLNNCINPLEDMLRFRQKWLRLGEYLHVGSLGEKHKKVKNIFNELRNNDRKIETFNKKVHPAIQKVIKSGSANKNILELLSSRPGEFARRLDLLLRETQDKNVIVEFKEVVGKVGTPLLVKLSKYLQTRTKAAEFRYFLPKGEIAKIHFVDGDDRKIIDQSLVDEIVKVIREELNNRYSQKESLKKVYVDPLLKKVLVPYAQRTASKVLNTVERGSRISLDVKTNTLRMFMYWKENDKSSRIDLDLSAVAFDKKWNFVTHLSWTSLSGLDSVHSGDIQSAPNGASEFIDISLDTFKKNKIHYVMMNVVCFTGQKFKDFECFAGIMERQNAKSGEIYEPTTVKNKFDLCGDSTVNMPLILDLEKMELIWCDVSLGKGGQRHVAYESKEISMVAKSITSMEKTHPNLFELFSSQVRARGGVVHTEKKDGVSYDLEMDLDKAKDITEILANWV